MGERTADQRAHPGAITLSAVVDQHAFAGHAAKRRDEAEADAPAHLSG
jgi:hypothetical protein